MAALLSHALQDEGSGPLLVLSHALGMDHRAWDPLREQLGPHARTLVFDHPGHGSSPCPIGACAMDAQIEAAATLLRSVARGPVVWVGIAMGATLGMGLAIRHPSLLQGLVLAGATAHVPEWQHSRWDAEVAAVQQEGMAAIADTVIGRYFSAAFRAARPDAQARVRTMLSATAPAAYVACAKALRSVDWRPGLQAIGIPTLVIAGALDEETPLPMGQAIAQGIPGAELVLLPAAAHACAMEQPDSFARLLRAFIRDRCPRTSDATTALPLDEYAQGMQHRRRILGDAWVDRSLANRTAFNSEFQVLITRYAWKDIWGRPAPGDRTRRFMVLSMMLGIHAWDEFALHVRAALDGHEESRLTPDDIKEVVLMAAIYCGVPVANHATGIVGRILRERGMEVLD